MFSFLKRSLRPGSGEPSSDAFAHTHAVDSNFAWTESASDLLHGADIVEFDGEFAATVFSEHFVEGPANPAR